jgi:hypothetical protein
MITYYLMLVETKSWIGGAVWREQDGKRVCIEADPILSWMLESEYEAAKAKIAERGWQVKEIRERAFNQKLRNR